MNIQYVQTSAFGGLDENVIAYKQSHGQSPGLIWCGGLKSDMEGTKAAALHDWALQQDIGFVRFDYFGHGASSGEFRNGTISRWTQDTLTIIDELTEGPQILIGSSMGGWTSLLTAQVRPERIKALVLIAPAPDFTEKLMWAGFSEDIRRTIMQDGIYYQPSDYDEPYEISRELILDGRENLLLGSQIGYAGPVRILQGMQDTSVPWQHALDVQKALVSDDTELTLVKNGDHSLSGPDDIRRLIRMVESVRG